MVIFYEYLYVSLLFIYSLNIFIEFVKITKYMYPSYPSLERGNSPNVILHIY